MNEQQLVIYESAGRRVLCELNYKTQSGIVKRLRAEADKIFGSGKWEKVLTNHRSLANITGWKAVELSEERRVVCIETKR